MWDHVRLVLGRALIVLGAALGVCWIAVAAYSRLDQHRLGGRLGSLHGTSRVASPVVVARATRAEANAEGLVGRIVIPRLGLDVVVLDGDDDATLARGVGHIPRTAYPGEMANAGIAGHRDSFFRALHRIARGDAMRVITPDGTFTYEVDRVLIVDPDRADLLAAGTSPRLTLVTCYPFRWIGPAPKRFVVQGHWVRRGARLAADGLSAPPARRFAPRARSADRLIPREPDARDVHDAPVAPGAPGASRVSGLV